MYITGNSDRYGPLPMFPAFHEKPSEERIERAVERLTDVADRLFLNGKVTQAQYDAWVSALNRWASDYYDAARFTRFGR